LAEAEQRLAQFGAIRAELATDPHTDHHPYWLLTISAGEHTARAAIAWADESLTALGQLTLRTPARAQGLASDAGQGKALYMS
jgi:hypothetical protein